MALLIQKRDGRLDGFNKRKIEDAILSAFIEVDGDSLDYDYAKKKAENIASYVETQAKSQNKPLNVEEIQDMVESGLCSTKRHDIAKAYIIYRNERTKERGNSTDKEFNDFLIGKNEYWQTENSNKNPNIVTTQRDYIAGIASTDLARRFIFPQDVVKAHDEGIIHIHDMDYAAQNVLSNCELINLEDMLQNGTVINNVLIEKPHRFITACTITTQIITAVTSSTYGGCTITLTHLAPFVRDSYNIYQKKYIDRGFNKQQVLEFAKEDLHKEIVDGVQTFNYQINSMTNTNGQSPFLSVCMYLGETEEYKEELAMIIEEFLKQRYQGFKNKVGVYITPAFPKLLYFLEEDNITEDSKYWYLTKLAAKCSAKRLTPDYISVKKMKEYKINPNTGKGEVYPCINKTCA